MLDIPTCKFCTNIEELLKYRTSLLKGCYDAPKPSIRPAIKTIYDLHSDVKKNSTSLHIIIPRLIKGGLNIVNSCSLLHKTTYTGSNEARPVTFQ